MYVKDYKQICKKADLLISFLKSTDTFLEHNRKPYKNLAKK